MTPGALARRLAALGEWHHSRSSGPGGQHRDNAETRVVLIIRASDLAPLGAAEAARVGAALGLDRRPLRLSSQADRSRERNRAHVMSRLERRLAAALAPRAPRIPTRPSRAARRRRLEAKAHRGALKRLRRPPDDI